MAAIIGILTVLATVTADRSATIDHVIKPRSGTTYDAPKIATSMRAVDPAQFSCYRCWYSCFDEVADYPELPAQTTRAAAKGPETDPEAGDRLANKANHNRRHHSTNTAWYDAVAAIAHTSTILGDKDDTSGRTK